MSQETPSSPAVLVVDDSADNLQLLGCLLHDFGYSPRLAISGEAALGAVRRSPPDLILLDVNMPGLSGHEVCERIKQEPEWATIPVIFLSGNGELENKVRGFNAGAVDYITKPFQPEEVRIRLRTHLELHRLQAMTRRHAEELEEVVRQRTRELAQSNARLARLDEAKSDFLTVISHELRTPLNGLLGVAEMLLAELPESPLKAEYHQLHQHSRHRILELVEDAQLLSALRVEPSELSPGEGWLEDILAAAWTEARARTEERNVSLRVEGVVPRVALRGEPALLSRAMRCLLEVAGKFSAAGEPIGMGFEVGEEAVTVRIRLASNPLKPEHLERFFEVLAIGQSLAAGGDMGLSPAVAAQIIQVGNGGTVKLANRPEGGLEIMAKLIRAGQRVPGSRPVEPKL